MIRPQLALAAVLLAVATTACSDGADLTAPSAAAPQLAATGNDRMHKPFAKEVEAERMHKPFAAPDASPERMHKPFVITAAPTERMHKPFVITAAPTERMHKPF